MAHNRVVRARRIIGYCLGIAVMMAGLCALAAAGAEGSAAETNAFNSGRKLFEDGQYELAENSFSNFLATYTNSTGRAYATLYVARAQLEQSNSASAVKLLLSS